MGLGRASVRGVYSYSGRSFAFQGYWCANFIPNQDAAFLWHINNSRIQVCKSVQNHLMQNTAYSGTDIIPFSKPKFRWEIRIEYADLWHKLENNAKKYDFSHHFLAGFLKKQHCFPRGLIETRISADEASETPQQLQPATVGACRRIGFPIYESSTCTSQ